MRETIKLFRLVEGIKLLLVGSVLTSLLGGVLGIARPFLFGSIVNSITRSLHANGFSSVELALVALLVVSILGGVVEYFNDVIGDRLQYRTYQSLREQVFGRLLQLSVDFFETSRTGEVVGRVTNGISDLARFVNFLPGWFGGQLTVFVFSLAVVWYKSPIAGLVASLIVPINLGLRLRAARINRANRSEAREHDDSATGILTETITQLPTVRSFSQEQTALTNFKETVAAYTTTRLRVTYSVARIDFLISFLSNGLLTLTIGIMAYLAIHGRATPGDVVLVGLLLQQINGSLFPLTRFLLTASEVETTSQRITELIEERPTVADRPGAITLTHFDRLQFKSVSFRYPGKRNLVLRNVSFTLQKGQTLALVGPSGVGKSTITKLIMRFYDIAGGQMLVNGRDVRDYTQDSVREAMATVMQDVALFNDTIEENLRFARPDATKKEVTDAARRAHADEFIQSLPEGYATLVGERGIKLSGGQKQRVAIARAMLRDPELIILDEATSALDSESERLVQEGLSELLGGRTAVIIAHRLSTVMNADKILVFRSGRIVEQGTHAQLLKKKGLYARLFKLQSI